VISAGRVQIPVVVKITLPVIVVVVVCVVAAYFHQPASATISAMQQCESFSLVGRLQRHASTGILPRSSGCHLCRACHRQVWEAGAAATAAVVSSLARLGIHTYIQAYILEAFKVRWMSGTHAERPNCVIFRASSVQSDTSLFTRQLPAL